ncbi:uncharacterized protein LOC132786498 [Drosophila nasuta]|uniref:uncharacterized protein LOC132786498 n=1 Tax=Drosophila nasuta TaxID=42062 RepID=UPI00295E35F5|nr:uncharacterized protein LOC132786498 [Drosophila nasuta]
MIGIHFVLVALLVVEIKANCLVRDADVLATNRIFAKRVGSHLELLRNNLVPTGGRLRSFCSSSDFVDSTCRANRRFFPALPTSNCTRKPEAIVELVDDDKCPFSMFRVGYKLNAQQFLEVYRSCYDIATQRSVFSIHELHRHNLTTKCIASGFTTENVTISRSFQAKSILNRFNEILGKQNYTSNDRQPYLFNRGHLTPAADFGFCEHTKATYKYINVMAQFSNINNRNWKRIEHWVRQLLAHNEKLTVCTGGLGILQLENEFHMPTNISLASHNRNPVYKWIYKLVKSNTSHYGFLTYNNIFEDYRPMPICNPIICPAELKLTPSALAGFSFCCDVDDFISRYLRHLQSVC